MGKYFRHKVAFLVDSCPICGAGPVPLTKTKSGKASMYCGRCQTRIFFNSREGVELLREQVGFTNYTPAVEDYIRGNDDSS